MKEYWIWASFWGIFGGAVGMYLGIWYAERTHKRERKDRQDIANMVKNARTANQQRRVAP